MTPRWLFSYGTFQDPEIQEIFFGRVCRMKKATLPGWSVFASGEDGYLFIRPDPDGRVDGTVIEVAASEIRVADLWEELPLYQRETLSVRLEDGRRIDAWVYTRRNGIGTPYGRNGLSIKDRDSVLAEARSMMAQDRAAKLKPGQS